MSEILQTIQSLPSWVQLAIALTLFGVVWKKSTLPNRWLPVLNVLIGALANPFLGDPGSVGPHHDPRAVLAFQGFLAGLGAEVFHDGIVTKIKGFFPGLNFLPDLPPGPEI